VIVVTKFDNFYMASEEYSQISEEKIKENVCASIESATGSTNFHFPKQNIVPVSGKMALFARRLRRMKKLKKSILNSENKIAACLLHFVALMMLSEQ